MSKRCFAAAGFFITISVLASWSRSATIPRLWYDFDEPAGGATPVVDHGAAPAVDGSFSNGATRVNDTPNGYSRGAGDLSAPVGTTFGPAIVAAMDAEKIDALDAITLTVWINLRDEPSKTQANIVMSDLTPRGSVSSLGGWELTLSSAFPDQGADDFTMRFFVLNSDHSGQGINSLTGLDADHQWLFFAVTMNSSGAARTYAGSPTSPVALRTSVTIPQHTILDNFAPLNIGGSLTSGGYTPPMWIDDVRVYDAALTQAEVEAVRLSNIPEPGSAGLLFALAALAGAAGRRTGKR